MGSPMRLMWCSQCCNLPTCDARLRVWFGRLRYIIALHIRPLQNLLFGCEIPDAVKLSVRGLIRLILNTLSLFPHSSIYSIYNAPGQSYCGQHHPLLVPAWPAEWSHPGLWATVLWKGIGDTATHSPPQPSLFHINISFISFSPYPPK